MHFDLRSFLTLTLGIILLNSLVLAQAPQKVKILGITVEGNTSVSESSITVQSGLITGRMVDYADISDAVRDLWELRIFSDVQIKMDKATDAGIFLIIQVQEYPRCGKVEITGNKKISDTKIKEEVYIVPGKVLSPFLLGEISRKIKELYKEDGYLLADVENIITDTDKEHIKDLEIKIKENKKVRIDEIVFEGNTAFSDRKLRSAFDKTKERFLLLFRLGKFDKNEFEEDKKLLRTFYRSHGYRDMEIINDTISYSEDKKKLQMKLFINEGNLYRYRNISFTGNTLYDDDILLASLGLKKGDLYNQEEFEKGMYERIQSLYMDRGYLFFNISPMEVPIGENEVDVELQITENYEVTIHRINFVGNDKTYDKVMRRELKIYPGEKFSRAKLMRSQRELFMLNYFANVTPDVVPKNDKEVDLEFTVEERSADRANLSISYSELYGFIGGGGVEFNNLMGTGQQLTLSYQQGVNYSFSSSGTAAYKSVSVGYTEPWLFDTPNLVGGSIYYSERGSRYSTYGYQPYDRNSYGASVRFGRRFRWPDNYFQGIWSLGYSHSEITNIDPSYTTASNVTEGYAYEGVSLSQTISRNSLDRPQFPTMGSSLSLTSTFSGGPLGGKEDFHKHVFQMDNYVPVFWKFVFKNSVEFGVLSKLKEDSYIPYYHQFYLGGAGMMVRGTSLRGYEENTVGPVQDYGGRWLAQGNSLLKYSLELRLSISENPVIYGLAFMEAGNLWKDLSSTDPFNLMRSVGFGARMFMPQIGMIGVDFGYGLDEVITDDHDGPAGWKTHFIFGMPF
ncbi:MAG: outer membrane protein assembly factor BamA [Candidatus Marinimicrobia bacterium]|nr:outer membrane protein assembly factor BamA [Candidatus Neomarinimicrobiota bacterium]